jgi:guanylate kinase
MKPYNTNPAPFAPKTFPLVLVLSGPSGAGKDAVLNMMKARNLPVSFIVTNTTRPMRPGEVDNIHYHFASQQEFTRLIDTDELLEHAEVYGNYYGVPKAPVRQAVADGKDVIIKVDVQGALAIKTMLPDTVLIFLMPPSLEELAQRLNGRRTESERELKIRIDTARAEIEQLPSFDYCVMSYQNFLHQAVNDIDAILRAERLRVSRRRYQL